MMRKFKKISRRDIASMARTSQGSPIEIARGHGTPFPQVIAAILADIGHLGRELRSKGLGRAPQRPDLTDLRHCP
jgi:hypothetical protein